MGYFSSTRNWQNGEISGPRKWKKVTILGPEIVKMVQQDLWAQKLMKWCNFCIQKLTNKWFSNSYGPRNWQNGVISGPPGNWHYGREDLYQHFFYHNYVGHPIICENIVDAKEQLLLIRIRCKIEQFLSSAIQSTCISMIWSFIMFLNKINTLFSMQYCT